MKNRVVEFPQNRIMRKGTKRRSNDGRRTDEALMDAAEQLDICVERLLSDDIDRNGYEITIKGLRKIAAYLRAVADQSS